MKPSHPNHEIREKPVILGFAVEVWQRGKKPRLKWRWRRIGAVITILILFAYILFSSTLYWYYKEHRQFEEVTFTQILSWPIQRAEFRRAMGAYFIKRSKEEFERGNISEGFYFLKAGVARRPEDLEARLLLSEILAYAVKREDLAFNLLDEGFAYADHDTDYLRHFIRLLMRYHADKRLIQFASDHLLPPEDFPNPETLDEESNRWNEWRWHAELAHAAARALYYRGNYDQAEALLESYHLKGGHNALLLEALIQWKRGRKSHAIESLESGLNQYPESSEYYLQLARFHREQGNTGAARRYLILRALNDPDNPMPRIDLLYSYNQMGDTQRELSEIESLLRNHSTDEHVLQYLADFASETGQVALARRLYTIALQENFEVPPFVLRVIESQIVAGRYREAMVFCDEIMEEEPDWLDANWTLFNSLRIVAYFGNGKVDLGRHYLNELLESKTLRTDTLLAVSRRLQQIDHHDESINILRSAYAKDPENQAALTALIRAELTQEHVDDLTRLVSALLEMRQPSRALLDELYDALSSDRYFFNPDQQQLIRRLRDSLHANS